MQYRAVPTDGLESPPIDSSFRPWRVSDAADFSTMNADVDVMADLGGPLTRGASDDKLDRFCRTFEEHRITRWVVTNRTGRFSGLRPCSPQRRSSLGQHYDIGWRLTVRVGPWLRD